jgi:hypothetical protein
MKKHLCKIFFNILEGRHDITFNDIYNIYVYILENTIENDDIFINILFIDLLKMIPVDKLSNIYKKYIDKCVIIDVIKKKKTGNAEDNMYKHIYMLNRNIYLFSKKCNIEVLKEFQNVVKYKMLCNANNANNDICPNYLNEDDVFSLVNINNIHPRKLFTIKDVKGTYAFDIVELEYFVRKCQKDKVLPYNPYTRELLNDKVIWRLYMKIKYNNITKKSDDCGWTTDMNAYTDLSIEIERRGFYNNPEWFKKMTKRDFLKCIKLFRDFSSNIEESKEYFLNINDNSFIFDFCKESIKLFNECNDDLYILCCNFMKSLALCSNDFYNNIPEWLSVYETTSYISSLSNLSNFTSFISTMMNNNNSNNINIPNNEYANEIASSRSINEYNFGIGDDILNNRINNILSVNDQSNLLNTNNDNILISSNSTINPSNNFLLYYYVEYM